MADEKDNESKKIKPEFDGAVAGTAPPAQTPEEQLIPPASAKPRDQFSGAARVPRVKPDGRISGKSGKTPHGVVTDTPQVSFGSALLQFFHMLSLLLTGKHEQFDREYSSVGGFKDKYVDPVERDDPSVKKITPQERSAIRDMNKTLQDMRVTFDPNLPRVDRLRKMAEIPGVQKLLSLIQKQESNGGDYNVVNGGGKPRINGKLLTECTVAEIIDAQAKGSRTQWGGQTEAAGAFQVMPDTLLASVKRLGINPQTTLFNKQTQDLIGMDLMENRGLSAFLTGGMKLSDFMLGIAKEWAGMPLDETGKAYHGGSANNPSFVSPEVGKAVTETLKGLRPT